MAKKQAKKIEYAPSARQRKEAERAKAEKEAKKRAKSGGVVTEQKTSVATDGGDVEVAATGNVGTAAMPRKKKLVIVITAVALAVVLLLTALFLFLFIKKYPSDGAYATFRLEYLDKNYSITYELKDVDTSSDNLGVAVASFVSWANKGVYNETLLHKFDPDSGCVEGGRYTEYKAESSSGTRIMTHASTKDTAWHDYYYYYSTTTKKDPKIGAKYNLSVMPYSGTSTFRTDFRLCVNNGKTNLNDLAGYIVGVATEKSEEAIDRLYAAIDEEVQNGLADLTPIKLKSVSIDGNRRTKWSKYDFFSDHTTDQYPHITY